MSSRPDHPCLLAWRLLAHQPGRLAGMWLAMGAAVSLLFVQFGLFFGITDSATALSRNLRCDFVVLDAARERLASGAMFPERVLRLVRNMPGVQVAAALRTDSVSWWGVDTPGRIQVTLLGIEPAHVAFIAPAVAADADALRGADTALVDRRSRLGLGAVPRGARAWLEGRPVRVAGSFSIGADILREGTVVVSEETFAAATGENPEQIDLALVRLEPGANATQVRARLRAALGDSRLVLTPREFVRREFRTVILRSTVGIVFAFLVLAAGAVGVLVCYQLLFALVHQLRPQLALLRALGWPQASLERLVLALAAAIGLGGFGCGLLASGALYHAIETQALLGIGLTPNRTLSVAIIVAVVTSVAAWLALRRVRRADAAELYSS